MTNPSPKNKTDFPMSLPEFRNYMPPLDLAGYNFALSQFEKAITLTEQMEALGELESLLADVQDNVEAAIDIAKREVDRRATLAKEAAEDPRDADMHVLHVFLGGITNEKLQAYLEYRKGLE